MLRNVFLKTLRDQRRALLWWTISALALGLYLALLYPSIAKTPEYNQVIEAWPKELVVTVLGEFRDYNSPVGFLNSSMFFLCAPVVLLIYAIALGSNAIAGEEERGTMDLLLSNPLPRWRLVLEKFAALTLLTTALGFALWLGLAIGAVVVDMDISLGRLAEVTWSGVLLALAFGTLALALGCVRGNRGMSVGVASALALAAYLLNSLAPLTETLKPYRKLSLFYHYIGADPLANGLNPVHAAVLVGVTVVLLAVALIAFERRDVAV